MVATKSYFSRWLGKAIKHSWTVLDTLGTLLGSFVVPIVVHYFPSLKSRMNHLLLEIPVGAALGLLCARFIAAPFLIDKERQKEVDALTLQNEKLQKSLEQGGPELILQILEAPILCLCLENVGNYTAYRVCIEKYTVRKTGFEFPEIGTMKSGDKLPLIADCSSDALQTYRQLESSMSMVCSDTDAPCSQVIAITCRDSTLKIVYTFKYELQLQDCLCELVVMPLGRTTNLL